MSNLVHFGECILDLETGDLHKDGLRSRLPDQQLRILEALLVRQGGVVTREDIRKKLWPNDTIVEFDRSINAAIMKLRTALGDSVEKPRWIETIARRGYRIMVSVQLNEDKTAPIHRPDLANHSLIGQKVSHYRVISLLGGGGMGMVYRGEDLKLNRPVALKFLPTELATDAHTLDRFELEARTASSLNHPNICTIYQVAEHQNQPFIVMELLEGETLRQRISRFTEPKSSEGRRLTVDKLLDIAIQISEGLEAAHRKDIIHRDIKPANIFITSSGQVKILDFGLARISTHAPELPFSRPALEADQLPSPHIHNLSISGKVVGTIGYMSPEQVRGEELDARSDLFSLGIVLYEMTTGRQPFASAATESLFYAILHHQAPPPTSISPSIPMALERLILRLLEKRPTARFRHSAEVTHGLRTIRQQQKLLHTQPSRDTPSIAVLPFEDLSADRSQLPFCEGMAAEIINALGAVDGLRVISRTSSVLCRDKKMELDEIGVHLNVQSVLEGTVRKSGSHLRITAHLISTLDGSQKWSERYDRDEGDIFKIQDEITAAIVHTLRLKLVPNLHSARPTENLDAYKLYLRGRYFWERRNRAYLQSAMTCFDQAIAADPEYALPHSGLADCYLLMATYSIKPHADTYPKALTLAQRSLQLNPDLAEGHQSLGAIRMLLERDWARAEASFTRALELDPKLVIARAYRALLYAASHRWNIAIEQAMTAVQQEPDSGLICYLAAATQFCAGNPEAATLLIERALDLEPKAIMIHWIRSWIFALSGRAAEAITEGLRAAIHSDHHQMLVSGLGVAYARAGRLDEAMQLIQELQERSAHECIASQWIGEIYLALNRHDDALDAFERGIDEKNSFLLALASAPQYHPLYNQPRFKSLLKRMNLNPGA